MQIHGGPPPLPPTADAAAGSISARIAWLVLLCKLNGRTELYREAAISYLFLANNLQYIVRKVKESSLGVLLGDEWALRHAEKAACKGRGVVSDAEMREQVRESVEKMIVPPYRVFYERCKAAAAEAAALRFSPEDMRNRIDVIFTASSASSIGNRGSIDL